MRYIVLTVLAALASGCVSSSQVASLQRQLRELQDANFALQERLAEDSGETVEVETPAPTKVAARDDEAEAHADAESTPHPSPLPEGEREDEVVAPPRRPSPPQPLPPVAMPMDPPQHWARAYQPPQIEGCEEGETFSLEIVNRTSWYLEVLMDGTRLRVFGGAGTLPHLPPGQSAFVCLNRLGRHAFMGRAYARRGDRLVQVDDFSFTETYSPTGDGHRTSITEMVIRWHPMP